MIIFIPGMNVLINLLIFMQVCNQQSFCMKYLSLIVHYQYHILYDLYYTQNFHL